MNQPEIACLAERVWAGEAMVDAEVSIILNNDDFLRSLNRRYLSKNDYTDVIAFPLKASPAGRFEGEIYISLDRVQENAAIYGVTLQNEVNRVVVHGLLHFLGYDDKSKDDRSAMRSREDFYLQ